VPTRSVGLESEFLSSPLRDAENRLKKTAGETYGFTDSWRTTTDFAETLPSTFSKAIHSSKLEQDSITMLCDFCLTITPELLHSGKSFKFQNCWRDIVSSAQGGCTICQRLEQDSGIWWKESMTERVELWAESETPFLSGRSGTTLWLGIKDMRPLAIYTVYIPRGNLNVQLTFWR
jgi:hypothetical protein